MTATGAGGLGGDQALPRATGRSAERLKALQLVTQDDEVAARLFRVDAAGVDQPAQRRRRKPQLGRGLNQGDHRLSLHAFQNSGSTVDNTRLLDAVSSHSL
jgi:hypothetical protein